MRYLHPHFHSILLDGLYVQDTPGKPPRFVRMRHPTDEDLRLLEVRLAHRVYAALVQSGYVSDEAWNLPDLDDFAPGPLARIQSASLQHRIALGPRSGSGIEKWREGIATDDHAPQARHPAALGFSLFVGPSIPPGRRETLERLCRYLARPPLSNDRLAWTPEGKVRYELPRPRSDGTSAIQFQPLELIEKLAALVPRPRAHLVRYHGILAPNAALRPLVVPAKQAPVLAGQGPTPGSPPTGLTPWVPWSELLKRVFKVDVAVCDRCGGRRLVIAMITEPTVITAILESMNLPTQVPSVAAARAS